MKETSRLVLYLLTNAKSGAERETAAKYAHVVDYLYREGIDSADVVEYVQSAGGKDGDPEEGAEGRSRRLRTHSTLMIGTSTEIRNPDDADDSASSDAADDLFDPEQDASLRLGSEALAQVLSSEIQINEGVLPRMPEDGLNRSQRDPD